MDLAKRLPLREVGAVPTVPRQWLWVLSDAGFVELSGQLGLCARSLASLTDGEPAQVGRLLPGRLQELVRIRSTLALAVRETSWFEPPADDLAGNAVDHLVVSANQVLEQVEASLCAAPTRSQMDDAIRESESAASELARLISDPADDDTPPVELVRRLFAVPPDQEIGEGNLDPNLLRSASALDTAELDALSKKLLAYALPSTARWVPNPTIFLAGVLLSDRPLVAHRVIAYTRDLVISRFQSAPKAVTRALVAQRKRGPNQFTSHREIATELEALSRAHDRDDSESVALATARLYAAAAEGPVRNAATTVLDLSGTKIPPNSTLTFLRDSLKSHVGIGLDHAIEPEWRNAIDHREYYWDPSKETLILRGNPVDRESVFNRYAFGMAIVAGMECGITIGVAASSGLIEKIDAGAPLQSDRVLVEHRLGQQLAVQGISHKMIRTTPGGMEVGPLADVDVENALAALAGAKHLDQVDRLEVQFETLPPLITGADSRKRSQALLHRDAEQQQVLDEAAAIPMIVDGLISNGSPPHDAVDCILRLASEAFALASSPRDGNSPRKIATHLQRAAKRSRQAIREGELVAEADSTDSGKMKTAFMRLERSLEAFLVRPSTKPDLFLRDLKLLSDLFAELPAQSVPWLESTALDDSQTG